MAGTKVELELPGNNKVRATLPLDPAAFSVDSDKDPADEIYNSSTFKFKQDLNSYFNGQSRPPLLKNPILAEDLSDNMPAGLMFNMPTDKVDEDGKQVSEVGISLGGKRFMTATELSNSLSGYVAAMKKGGLSDEAIDRNTKRVLKSFTDNMGQRDEDGEYLHSKTGMRVFTGLMDNARSNLLVRGVDGITELVRDGENLSGIKRVVPVPTKSPRRAKGTAEEKKKRLDVRKRRAVEQNEAAFGDIADEMGLALSMGQNLSFLESSAAFVSELAFDAADVASLVPVGSGIRVLSNVKKLASGLKNLRRADTVTSAKQLSKLTGATAAVAGAEEVVKAGILEDEGLRKEQDDLTTFLEGAAMGAVAGVGLEATGEVAGKIMRKFMPKIRNIVTDSLAEARAKMGDKEIDPADIRTKEDSKEALAKVTAANERLLEQNQAEIDKIEAIKPKKRTEAQKQQLKDLHDIRDAALSQNPNAADVDALLDEKLSATMKAHKKLREVQTAMEKGDVSSVFGAKSREVKFLDAVRKNAEKPEGQRKTFDELYDAYWEGKISDIKKSRPDVAKMIKMEGEWIRNRMKRFRERQKLETINQETKVAEGFQSLEIAAQAADMSVKEGITFKEAFDEVVAARLENLPSHKFSKAKAVRKAKKKAKKVEEKLESASDLVNTAEDIRVKINDAINEDLPKLGLNPEQVGQVREFFNEKIAIAENGEIDENRILSSVMNFAEKVSRRNGLSRKTRDQLLDVAKEEGIIPHLEAVSNDKLKLGGDREIGNLTGNLTKKEITDEIIRKRAEKKSESIIVLDEVNAKKLQEELDAERVSTPGEIQQGFIPGVMRAKMSGTIKEGVKSAENLIKRGIVRASDVEIDPAKAGDGAPAQGLADTNPGKTVKVAVGDRMYEMKHEKLTEDTITDISKHQDVELGKKVAQDAWSKQLDEAADEASIRDITDPDQPQAADIFVVTGQETLSDLKAIQKEVVGAEKSAESNIESQVKGLIKNKNITKQDLTVDLVEKSDGRVILAPRNESARAAAGRLLERVGLGVMQGNNPNSQFGNFFSKEALRDIGELVLNAAIRAGGNIPLVMKAMKDTFGDGFKAMRPAIVGMISDGMAIIGRTGKPIVEVAGSLPIVTGPINAAKGFNKFYQKSVENMGKRLNRISPRIWGIVQRYNSDLNVKRAERLNQMEGFQKGYNSLSEEAKLELDKALFNGNRTKAQDILVSGLDDAKGAIDSMSNVFNTLDEMAGELDGFGLLGGMQKGFFPRSVKDFKGLRKVIESRIHKDVIDKRVAKVKKDLGKDVLTKEEMDMLMDRIVNDVVTGKVKMPSNLNSRKIEFIDDELRQFYQNPVESYARYITDLTKAIEQQKMFGASRVSKSVLLSNKATTRERSKDVFEFNKEMSNSHLDDTIQGDLRKELNKLNEEDREETVRILASALRGPKRNAFITKLKAFGYLASITQFATTFRQLGDVLRSGEFNGYRNTFNNVRRRLSPSEHSDMVKMKDLGLDQIMIELEAGNTDGISKALDVSTQATGLRAMDRLGKDVTIQSSLDKIVKASKNKDSAEWKAFEKDMVAAMGKEDFDKAVSQLNSGDLDLEGKALLFNEITQMQPVGILDMPRWATGRFSNKAGNVVDLPGVSMLFMLKSFAFKNAELAKARTVDKLLDAAKLSVSKNPDDRIIAAQKAKEAVGSMMAISMVTATGDAMINTAIEGAVEGREKISMRTFSEHWKNSMLSMTGALNLVGGPFFLRRLGDVPERGFSDPKTEIASTVSGPLGTLSNNVRKDVNDFIQNRSFGDLTSWEGIKDSILEVGGAAADSKTLGSVPIAGMFHKANRNRRPIGIGELNAQEDRLRRDQAKRFADEASDLGDPVEIRNYLKGLETRGLLDQDPGELDDKLVDMLEQELITAMKIKRIPDQYQKIASLSPKARARRFATDMQGMRREEQKAYLRRVISLGLYDKRIGQSMKDNFEFEISEE